MFLLGNYTKEKLSIDGVWIFCKRIFYHWIKSTLHVDFHFLDNKSMACGVNVAQEGTRGHWVHN